MTGARLISKNVVTTTQPYNAHKAQLNGFSPDPVRRPKNAPYIMFQLGFGWPLRWVYKEGGLTYTPHSNQRAEGQGEMGLSGFVQLMVDLIT